MHEYSSAKRGLMKKIFLLLTLLVTFNTTLEALVGLPFCGCWSGIYAGANIGGGWSHKSGSRGSYSSGLDTPVAIGNDIPSSYRLHPSGVVGGAQIGYNAQLCLFVVGVEADVQKTAIKSRNTVHLPGNQTFVPTVGRGTSSHDWLTTLRARVGYSCNKTLLFATLGGAVGYVKNSASLTGDNAFFGNFRGHRKRTKFGLAAGVGVEYAALPCIRLKLEYLFVGLDKNTVTTTDPVNFPGEFLKFRFKYQENIVRAGINFHL